MCGIVGSVAGRKITPMLLEGLKRLEYRGYDSTGIAILDVDGLLQLKRRVGKISELERCLETPPLDGWIGIAHSRWATHGAATETNAHPHMSRSSVAVVHNGIVENHFELRVELQRKGFEFVSDTDTEVIAHQIQDFIEQGFALVDAVRGATVLITGSYAIGVISVADPDRLIAARNGSPLVIGLGDGENFIASDVFALLKQTRKFVFLEDGDIAILTRDKVEISGKDGEQVFRPVKEVNLAAADSAGHAGYRHYMLKEIWEQPVAIQQTLEGRIDQNSVNTLAFGAAAAEAFKRIESVQIVACGTSYHAGLVARYWIESVAGLACSVEVASEFRYREHVVPKGTLFVTISQSGETADTLAALSLAKQLGYAHTLTFCNVEESSIVRASGSSLLTRAGPEIGVASTKAFTTQLASLLMMVVCLGRQHGLRIESESKIVAALRRLPALVRQALMLEPQLKQWAIQIAEKDHALYLGRGSMYPVAMEGALKLKEISYIHAEGYPSGELKHGPLALVDENMPVLALAPNNALAEKLNSNLQEVRARGGRVYVIAGDSTAMDGLNDVNIVRLPDVDELIAPIVYSIPLQLLAYHVALIRGTDLDQPRNLAKSVTVE